MREIVTNSISHSVEGLRNLAADMKPLVEDSIEKSELDTMMQRASLPVLSFYLMLFFATAIATFGLLSNSAPTIIGAMIIAPLMHPILSLSYGIVIVDGRLMYRSLLTMISGILLVIVLAFLSTKLLGLRISGSEILSRSHPTLLDLGVAIAAGGAAAFAYTRRSIMNAIAGVAIAVALVPPLAVTGIGLAQGMQASADVGYSLTELGFLSGGEDIAAGAFLLFLTNLAGIIVTAGALFTLNGYGQWQKATIGLSLVAMLSVGIVYPLGVSLFNLYVKSSTLSLIAVMHNKHPDLFSGKAKINSVSVKQSGNVVIVGIDAVGPREDAQKNRLSVELIQQYLTKSLGRPVIVELELIPVDLQRHIVKPGETKNASLSINNHDLTKAISETKEKTLPR